MNIVINAEEHGFEHAETRYFFIYDLSIRINLKRKSIHIMYINTNSEVKRGMPIVVHEFTQQLQNAAPKTKVS